MASHNVAMSLVYDTKKHGSIKIGYGNRGKRKRPFQVTDTERAQV